MDTGKTLNRSKVLESIALLRSNGSSSLRNKITKNIECIKEDIALLKEVLEKTIGICQAYDYSSCLEL
ncbi:6697_t:CDS:1, partial [Entrophospora sp. SA101]